MSLSLSRPGTKALKQWTCLSTALPGSNTDHSPTLYTLVPCRFSSDTSIVDDSLPFILNILLANAVSLVGLLAVLLYSQPLLGLVLLPLGVMYRWGIVLLVLHHSGWHCCHGGVQAMYS